MLYCFTKIKKSKAQPLGTLFLFMKFFYICIQYIHCDLVFMKIIEALLRLEPKYSQRITHHN